METTDTSACHIEFKVTAMEPESEADELRSGSSTTKVDDSFVNKEPFQSDDVKEEELTEQLETGFNLSGECVVEEMQVEAEEFHIEELSSADSDSQTDVKLTTEVSSVDTDSESQPEMEERYVNLTAEGNSIDFDGASQPESVGADVQLTTEVSSADSDSVSQPEDLKFSDQNSKSNEETMDVD